MKQALLLFLSLIFCIRPADARIYIPIDQPSDKKFPIAICDLKGGGGFGEEVAEIIRNDLILSGYFNVFNRELIKGTCKDQGTSLETIRFSYWAAAEAQAVVAGTASTDGGEIVIMLQLFDPYTPTLLVGKEYRGKNKQVRDMAHRFSDDIMESLTGMRGVFATRIAFTTPTGKKTKEISIMDMDGERESRITSLKSISLSPAWSPKGNQLTFTSYKNGNPDLYTIEPSGKGLKQLTRGPGAKITPAWSPDGSKLIYASTASGEAELMAITPQGRELLRLTNAIGIDLSPSFSPDGNEIIFASERAGNLHLFRMNAAGEGLAVRLTYIGYQNDMPSWSPRAAKIAFAGRDMGTFDIFIMNPDGSNIQRLTSRSGSNEHPSFSPDGRFITFSSDRGGSPAIYLMRADGSNQTRISKGVGMLPEWGPRRE